MLVGPMPSISLKTIILVHWFLFTWAASGWPYFGYVLCNFSVLAVAVWAIGDRHSVDALFMYLVMTMLSVIVDIVCLSVGFPNYIGHTGFQVFGAVMAILNLILKPISTVLIYQMYRDRGGEYNINFGPNSTSYDNIGEDSAGSSTDFRNVLQPTVHAQPHDASYGNKDQPLV